jgi:hypothetical protein
LRGLRGDIGEGEGQFIGMGGAIAACIKEFELKKKIPQKTPIGVTENNSHGETSVQTFFRHNSNQALGWPIYTRSAAGKLAWKCCGHATN